MKHLDRGFRRARAVGVAAGFVALVMGHAASSQTTPPTAIGFWRSVDDKTRQPKSIVETYLRGGKLCGRVTQLLGPANPSVDAKPRCTACTGAQKDMPIEGLEIMWDLVADRDSWENGAVLDPANGTIYRCRVRLRGPDRLEVRGFVGLPMFGRTQVWERVTVPPPPPATQSERER